MDDLGNERGSVMCLKPENEGWEHLDSTDPRLPMIRKAGKLMDYDHCVRLYNKDGEHILSLVRCMTDGGFDLVTPQGKNLYCTGAEMTSNEEYLVKMLIEHAGVEELDQKEVG